MSSLRKGTEQNAAGWPPRVLRKGDGERKRKGEREKEAIEGMRKVERWELAGKERGER